ncbi:branched-chain amino acid ABC transporter permease (plasmid) [Rhizobium sp. Pop5]|uniref:branched-chain amino acid ABC transporter permease n=1 Tax=Rhizobium sp. Pop5 TaxID=1223565 RepID=UPI000283AA6A|nr:branched-chain amino acid ABC transporter permease [Rhizobium sp. Pop5]EJZ18568.1 branched-chain amino acid transport system permease protein LivM [Rhizobium sp. Pop5]UVD60419.1 branched-chain amino acid ABC transporter permease [Rhizobium sp. Pop5]
MKNLFFPIVLAAILTLLALVPMFVDDYGLGLAIGVMSYVALCSSWALFSGPTRYVSLATVAFCGTGAYTVAALADHLPFYAILAAAALVGFVASLVVGLATLRLSGIYFVIFTFGLAEMVRQLLTWYEVNISGTLGRYIFVDVEAYQIFYMLLAIAAVALAVRWWIDRGRLGLAVRAIGDDEVVARHAGVDVTRVKLILFSISSVFITLVGAVQAPRWTYVEPSIVFNPTISFLTLIMALLGGASRLWGPVCGAVPLFFLFEWLSGRFPDHYSIILGLLFIGIVFLFPEGVLARFEQLWKHLVHRKDRKNLAKEVSNERRA